MGLEIHALLLLQPRRRLSPRHTAVNYIIHVTTSATSSSASVHFIFPFATHTTQHARHDCSSFSPRNLQNCNIRGMCIGRLLGWVVVFASFACNADRSTLFQMSCRSVASFKFAAGPNWIGRLVVMVVGDKVFLSPTPTHTKAVAVLGQHDRHGICRTE